MLNGLCVLHITNLCNLRCKHCYASAGNKLKDELTYEEITDIIDQLDEMNINYITVSGGEPLAREDVFDIIKYIRNKNINVMITTNGTLIDEQVIKKLKELKVDSVQISIDSHIPEVHDKFRGEVGCFEKAVNGIRLCKKNNIKVSLMSTLSTINRENINELIQFAVNLGVDGFAMKRFVPEEHGNNEKEIAITSKDLKKCLEIIYSSRQKYKNCFFTTNDPLFSFIDGTAEVMYSLTKENKNLCGGCSLGKMAFIITPDGEVGMCTRLYTKIGSIREKKIKQIIEENKLLNTICNRDNLKGKCGRCKYKRICGGCRGWAYQTTGDYLGEDNLCWLSEEEISL